MGTRHTAEPLQSKIWQLDQDQSSPQGFLYNCSLCDEILVLSRLFINPRKIQLAYSNICPGCGFELDKTLKVQTSTLPSGRRFLTNPVCKGPEPLIEPGESFEARLSRGSTLLRDVRSDLPSGIELLDQTLVLRFGQLVTLQGEASNGLSHLLCVRAVYPLPPGLGSDVVFVDGGNVFDVYTVSRHAFSLGLDQERTKLRIHLSRATGHRSTYTAHCYQASIHPDRQDRDRDPGQPDTDKIPLEPFIREKPLSLASPDSPLSGREVLCARSPFLQRKSSVWQ